MSLEEMARRSAERRLMVLPTGSGVYARILGSVGNTLPKVLIDRGLSAY